MFVIAAVAVTLWNWTALPDGIVRVAPLAVWVTLWVTMTVAVDVSVAPPGGTEMVPGAAGLTDVAIVMLLKTSPSEAWATVSVVPEAVALIAVTVCIILSGNVVLAPATRTSPVLRFAICWGTGAFQLIEVGDVAAIACTVLALSTTVVDLTLTLGETPLAAASAFDVPAALVAVTLKR